MRYSKQLGFTLIEIMVTVLISSILMAGAMQMFISTKNTYDLQSQMVKMQNNARFVMDEMTREIRMAGYAGCNATNAPITEFQGTTDGTTSLVIDGHTYPASDTLVINSIVHHRFIIDEDATDFSADKDIVVLENSSVWPKAGDTVTIHDCSSTMTYTVASGSPYIPTTTTTANPNAKPEVEFTLPFDNTMTSADIKYREPVDVYMGDLSAAYRVEATPDGEMALYRCYDTPANISTFCNSTGIKELFIKGVMNMQIRYGINTDPLICPPPSPRVDLIPNRYDKPTAGASSVMSVRVTLLMRTPEPRWNFKAVSGKSFFLDPDLNASDTSWNKNTYDLSTDNLDIEKAYRHRLFTTVVGVRNNIYNDPCI
ncbi:MAG: PilW family protein [Thiomargarita sp.]|nr:PilW family protein [Thiomargarita sp.]